MSAGLCSPEGSRDGYVQGSLSAARSAPNSHGTFSMYDVYIQIRPSCKVTNHNGFRSHHTPEDSTLTKYTYNYPVSEEGHSLRSWRSRLLGQKVSISDRHLLSLGY